MDRTFDWAEALFPQSNCSLWSDDRYTLRHSRHFYDASRASAAITQIRIKRWQGTLAKNYLHDPLWVQTNQVEKRATQIKKRIRQPANKVRTLDAALRRYFNSFQRMSFHLFIMNLPSSNPLNYSGVLGLLWTSQRKAGKFWFMSLHFLGWCCQKAKLITPSFLCL